MVVGDGLGTAFLPLKGLWILLSENTVLAGV